MSERMNEETRPARCVSILGTGSDTGKSIVVTALCRIFSTLGVRVSPFKAQNMSNNSYVTCEGGEMGRAQVVQAEAARVVPHVDMNPVLLKPSTDTRAQVILHGKPFGDKEAKEYFSNTDFLFDRSYASLQRLRKSNALIFMEGAGSCAEVNLRSRDFVNFRMAHAVDAPVILVADIDRGGVFGQIIGTLAVISEEDRRRIKGFIINRFRGDPDLFRTGIEYLQDRTGLPVIGLVPYYRGIMIDSEDGMPLDAMIDPPSGPEPGKTNVGVIRLPHISNFTDFNPLEREPSLCLHYLSRPRNLNGYDIIFLPGTKNGRFDMAWLRQTGWTEYLRAFADNGGRIGGICGGYQMLGRAIHDPYGLEGIPGETPCLGLLDAETTLRRDKVLSRSTGVWVENGESVEGYEIHMGVTEHSAGATPAIRILSQNGKPAALFDGATSSDGRIWGSYLHGLFDTPNFRNSFLRGICGDDEAVRGVHGSDRLPDFKNQQYDLLADHFQTHLDMGVLNKIIGVNLSGE
jgi:adenosylcobyric acid synthase